MPEKKFLRHLLKVRAQTGQTHTAIYDQVHYHTAFVGGNKLIIAH